MPLPVSGKPSPGADAAGASPVGPVPLPGGAVPAVDVGGERIPVADVGGASPVLLQGVAGSSGHCEKRMRRGGGGASAYDHEVKKALALVTDVVVRREHAPLELLEDCPRSAVHRANASVGRAFLPFAMLPARRGRHT